MILAAPVLFEKPFRGWVRLGERISWHQVAHSPAVDQTWGLSCQAALAEESPAGFEETRCCLVSSGVVIVDALPSG